MEYVKIGGVEYPATISGRMQDSEWDGRSSKTIKLSMSYADADALFRDGLAWSIVCESEDEDGLPIREEYDNSDYFVAGPIIDNRDGAITVKMGKLTDLEEAYEMLFGENA